MFLMVWGHPCDSRGEEFTSPSWQLLLSGFILFLQTVWTLLVIGVSGLLPRLCWLYPGAHFFCLLTSGSWIGAPPSSSSLFCVPRFTTNGELRMGATPDVRKTVLPWVFSPWESKWNRKEHCSVPWKEKSKTAVPILRARHSLTSRKLRNCIRYKAEHIIFSFC